MNAALEDLYQDTIETLADENPKNNPPDIPETHFLQAAKRVFTRQGYDPKMLAQPEALQLIRDTYQAYRKAVNTGIADNKIPEAMVRKLEHDAFMFSGFKIHHELSEVGLSLLDKDGKVKSYEVFAREVTKIHNRYNRNYLKSEYQFAVGSSQMAAKWQDVESNKGRYDLQYRTAGDERVREEHEMLNGITLPADDPFWKEYYPPNGWRCRCTAVEVNKKKYPVSDSKEALQRGRTATTKLDRFGNNKAAIFRFNPGMDEKLFPPKHPYGKVKGEIRKKIESMADKEVRKRLTPQEKEAIFALPVEEQFFKVYTDKKSGYSVLQHTLVDVNGEDYQQVLAVAKAYAKEGECRINPVVVPKAEVGRKKLYPGISDYSNPDLTTENYGYVDVKSPHRKNNIVSNANDACKQGGIAVITDLAMDEKLSPKDIDLSTGSIFSDKNKNQEGNKNYTKDTVHWFVNGKLHKFNRPKKK